MSVDPLQSAKDLVVEKSRAYKEATELYQRLQIGLIEIDVMQTQCIIGIAVCAVSDYANDLARLVIERGALGYEMHMQQNAVKQQYDRVKACQLDLDQAMSVYRQTAAELLKEGAQNG